MLKYDKFVGKMEIDICFVIVCQAKLGERLQIW